MMFFRFKVFMRFDYDFLLFPFPPPPTTISHLLPPSSTFESSLFPPSTPCLGLHLKYFIEKFDSRVVKFLPSNSSHWLLSLPWPVLSKWVLTSLIYVVFETNFYKLSTVGKSRNSCKGMFVSVHSYSLVIC